MAWLHDLVRGSDSLSQAHGGMTQTTMTRGFKVLSFLVFREGEGGPLTHPQIPIDLGD